MPDYSKICPELPWAQSVASADATEKARILKNIELQVREQQLVGLANDTKWNELIACMRGIGDLSYPGKARWRSTVLNRYMAPWEAAWEYHLPFPLRSVLCLDISCIDIVSIKASKAFVPDFELVDHSTALEAVIRRIGFDYKLGKKMLRIFGYAPRAMQNFDEEGP
jgi:hypothetical protein